MNNGTKNILYSNYVTCACALILGYSLWVMLSYNQIIQEKVAIPVTIYKTKDEIDQQTTIAAIIEGARHQLKSLYYHPPKVAIYRDERPGNPVPIYADDILLPETLTVLNYWPREITY